MFVNPSLFYIAYQVLAISYDQATLIGVFLVFCGTENH